MKIILRLIEIPAILILSILIFLDAFIDLLTRPMSQRLSDAVLDDIQLD